MTTLEIFFDTGGLTVTPPIEIHPWDSGSGTFTTSAAFNIRNSGTTPLTVTFDVVPEGGTPPSWFRVDQEQFTVPAGEYVRATVQVAVPGDATFERHLFRGRARSPGLATALSDPGVFSRPLPPGWALRSNPDTYLVVPVSGREATFTFHAPGFTGRLMFNVGAPDWQSAAWFSVDQAVQPDSADFATLAPSPDYRWRVTVDVEAMTAAGRVGIWLQPYVSIETQVTLEEDGASYLGFEWRPYAAWFGYGVELHG